MSKTTAASAATPANEDTLLKDLLPELLKERYGYTEGGVDDLFRKLYSVPIRNVRVYKECKPADLDSLIGSMRREMIDRLLGIERVASTGRRRFLDASAASVAKRAKLSSGQQVAAAAIAELSSTLSPALREALYAWNALNLDVPAISTRTFGLAQYLSCHPSLMMSTISGHVDSDMGHRSEFNVLTNQLNREHVMVMLVSPPGSGKTKMLLDVCRNAPALYFDCKHSVDCQHFLSDVAALDQQMSPVHTRAVIEGMWRRLLTYRLGLMMTLILRDEYTHENWRLFQLAWCSAYTSTALQGAYSVQCDGVFFELLDLVGKHRGLLPILIDETNALVGAMGSLTSRKAPTVPRPVYSAVISAMDAIPSLTVAVATTTSHQEAQEISTSTGGGTDKRPARVLATTILLPPPGDQDVIRLLLHLLPDVTIDDDCVPLLTSWLKGRFCWIVVFAAFVVLQREGKPEIPKFSSLKDSLRDFVKLATLDPAVNTFAKRQNFSVYGIVASFASKNPAAYREVFVRILRAYYFGGGKYGPVAGGLDLLSASLCALRKDADTEFYFVDDPLIVHAIISFAHRTGWSFTQELVNHVCSNLWNSAQSFGMQFDEAVALQWCEGHSMLEWIQSQVACDVPWLKDVVLSYKRHPPVIVAGAPHGLADDEYIWHRLETLFTHPTTDVCAMPDVRAGPDFNLVHLPAVICMANKTSKDDIADGVITKNSLTVPADNVYRTQQLARKRTCIAALCHLANSGLLKGVIQICVTLPAPATARTGPAVNYAPGGVVLAPGVAVDLITVCLDSSNLESCQFFTQEAARRVMQACSSWKPTEPRFPIAWLEQWD